MICIQYFWVLLQATSFALKYNAVTIKIREFYSLLINSRLTLFKHRKSFENIFRHLSSRTTYEYTILRPSRLLTEIILFATSHSFSVKLITEVGIYPTPPSRTGRDTKVSFKTVWIQSFPSSAQVAQLRLKNPVCLLFTHSWWLNWWIYAFSKST